MMYFCICLQYFCIFHSFSVFCQVSLPADELESLLSAADALQLSLLCKDQMTGNDDITIKDQMIGNDDISIKDQMAADKNVSTKCQQEWQDTAEQDLKSELKKVADKENKAKPMEPKLPALRPNQGLDKKIGLGKTWDKIMKGNRISIVQMDVPTGNDSKQKVNKKALCTECGKEFEAFNHLWVHIQAVHHQRHQCKNCGKRYNSASVLNQHVESAHNGIHLVCQDCGKKFGWQATLNKHIRKMHLKSD